LLKEKKQVVKPVKVREIRELSDVELQEKVRELKGELFNLRFQMATGQLENMMRIKEVRHAIARVKTVMRERELAAARN
jgi:large subunit ribosomal protein L29